MPTLPSPRAAVPPRPFEFAPIGLSAAAALCLALPILRFGAVSLPCPGGDFEQQCLAQADSTSTIAAGFAVVAVVLFVAAALTGVARRKLQFQAPPNWPPPPAGWQPPRNWQPPADWPNAPNGWRYWRMG